MAWTVFIVKSKKIFDVYGLKFPLFAQYYS